MKTITLENKKTLDSYDSRIYGEFFIVGQFCNEDKKKNLLMTYVLKANRLTNKGWGNTLFIVELTHHELDLIKHN
jgi:hypothetical protein